MNQPMPAVGESEVFWHLALRTDHLEKSLDAATNAGFEVTIPMRPLDLLNDVTGNRARCAWPSFADPMVNRSNFWRTKLVTREAAMQTIRDAPAYLRSCKRVMGLARIERANPDWSSVTLGDGLAEGCRRSASSHDDGAADGTTGLPGLKVQASVHGEAASSTSVPARSANNGIGFYKVKIAVGA